MSSSRVLSCLASVKKQAHDFHFFSFVQCIKRNEVKPVDQLEHGSAA